MAYIQCQCSQESLSCDKEQGLKRKYIFWSLAILSSFCFLFYYHFGLICLWSIQPVTWCFKGHPPKKQEMTANRYVSQNTATCAEERRWSRPPAEARVQTLVAIVDSGRAQASSYPRPHVRSRGPQLLPLLMFLTCSWNMLAVGYQRLPSSLSHGFSSLSDHLRLEILTREDSATSATKKEIKLNTLAAQILHGSYMWPVRKTQRLHATYQGHLCQLGQYLYCNLFHLWRDRCTVQHRTERSVLSWEAPLCLLGGEFEVLCIIQHCCAYSTA